MDLVRRDDIDLVLVLTSMKEHGPITQAALEAGKHVLVEKPMAVTLEEATRLVELAEESSGYLLCAPHVILSPTYQAIWRHLKQGDIGKVHLARARYGWAGPWWSQWYYRPGGGPLFDLGVYSVTSLTGLFGPAKRVMAMTGIAIPERVVDGEQIRVETEDNFQIVIEFGDALLASITTGFSMQVYRNPAIELYGEEGTLQMLGDDWAPEGYELYQNETGTWQLFDEPDPQWPWTDGLRHLVECIHRGTAPLIRPEHAYHVTEIMIKAAASGKDGTVKSLESTFTPPTFSGEVNYAPRHIYHDFRTGR
jgi:predicted dehydrogenase